MEEFSGFIQVIPFHYDHALGRLYAMCNYFLWNSCVDREYISVYEEE